VTFFDPAALEARALQCYTKREYLFFSSQPVNLCPQRSSCGACTLALPSGYAARFDAVALAG
jgi:hypothetical protein